MSAWSELTLAVAQNAMPTDMAALYAAWVDTNPSKGSRVAELVSETVGLFRQAVAANPANELSDDPDMVPTTGFRHALNWIFFNLGMEMGVQFAPEVYSLMTRADIWLRMVQDGAFSPAGTAMGAGAPSYAVGEAEARGLLWVG